MTWVVVLIKDFATAKQRLGPVLGPEERHRLAIASAGRALEAARAGDRVLAVCGSPEAAELARRAGAEVLLEARPQGQNPAARRGVKRALAGGAEAVILLSSDLPLVSRDALATLLQAGAEGGPKVVVAAAAAGRRGTNALYLRPPDVIGLHFGDDSLPRFEADARARGVPFSSRSLPELALDLDEPADLEHPFKPAAGIEVIPVRGLPEVQPGDDLARLIAGGVRLQDGDVVVVAQKVVSKAEGRLLDLRTVTPSARARRLAKGLEFQTDPRAVQVILDESVRVLREERVLITETRHGFVCANAGVDHSNVPGEHMVALLPEDPDRSAADLRQSLKQLSGAELAVIVADTFGRAWRMGIENVALGVAGLAALVDYRGQRDDAGKLLYATVVAVADELAAAAELVMGKTARVPVAVIRGYRAEAAPGTGRELVRPRDRDLFR